MDKKKLIGTIIGVLLFIALISGATYAWFTYSAVITNGNYTGITKVFSYTYSTGTNITNINLISGFPSRNSITDGNGYVALSAEKVAYSAKASSFSLVLKKPTNGITTENALKYAVCKSLTASDCDNLSSSQIPTTVSESFVSIGSVTVGTDDQVLYTDNSSFLVEGVASMNYYVYFWIDTSFFGPNEQSGVIGKSFSGSIVATSTQID